MRCLAGLLLALLLWQTPAAAQVLMSETEFRDAAIALIEAENPDAEIEIVDDLAIVVRGGGRPEFRINFDNGYVEYQRAPELLTEILDRWVSFAVAPPEQSQMVERIVSIVRHRDMAESYNTLMADAESPSTLVWRPLAGDLIEVLGFDGAETIQYATEETLADVGLTPAQAWALAPNNLPARLGALDLGGVEGADSLVYVSGGNGLAPSSLTDLCGASGGGFDTTLFLVVDRNGYIMGDGADARASQQFWLLFSELRQSGQSLSQTALACRDGRLAEVMQTD